jgi:homospermidine synthase
VVDRLAAVDRGGAGGRPHQNATTLQVAASIIAALTWMFENPNEGVNVPTSCHGSRCSRPPRSTSAPPFSGPADWDPVSCRRNLFAGFGDERDSIDESDPWQFTNFVV